MGQKLTIERVVEELIANLALSELLAENYVPEGFNADEGERLSASANATVVPTQRHKVPRTKPQNYYPEGRISDVHHNTKR